MNQISLTGFIHDVTGSSDSQSEMTIYEHQLMNPPEHVQQAMEHHFVPIVLMSDSRDKMILLLIDM